MIDVFVLRVGWCAFGCCLDLCILRWLLYYTGMGGFSVCGCDLVWWFTELVCCVLISLADYVGWASGSGVCLWLGILFGICGVVLVVVALVIAWLGVCGIGCFGCVVDGGCVVVVLLLVLAWLLALYLLDWLNALVFSCL